MSAHDDWSREVRFLQRTEQFAKMIAPSFRERFDFTDASHHKTCAELTYDLAAANARKFQDVEDALRAKYEPIMTIEIQADAERKAAEDAKAKLAELSAKAIASAPQPVEVAK